LIRSSKDVLARLEGPDAVQSYPGMERRASRAPTRVKQTTDSCPDEERRRREELPPDIITLIASCGERIQKTDSIELRDVGVGGRL
jgi:hypothetical protein